MSYSGILRRRNDIGYYATLENDMLKMEKPRMKKNSIRYCMVILAAMAMTLFFSGCVRLEKPYPVKQYFVLEAKRDVNAGSVATSKASIRVKDPEISPLFSSKSFVYRTNELEYTTDFYNEFFIVPDRMVKNQITEWLNNSKAFRRISPDPGEKSEYILETNIVRLYLDKTVSPNKAVMETGFFLLSGDKGTGNIIWHGVFKEEIQVKNDSSAATAEAFSKALEKNLIYLEKNLRETLKN